jgi:hypothetical protein
MAKDKTKSKKPYAKVRLVPEDSKMKDHGFYYYAMKPLKGEKRTSNCDCVSLIPSHRNTSGGWKRNYHHTASR